MDRNSAAWYVKRRLIELHGKSGRNRKSLLSVLKDEPRISRMLDGNAAPPSFTLKSIEKFAKHFNLTFQEFIGIPPPSKGKWEYLAKDLDTVLAHAGREVTDAEIKMIEAGIQQALRNVLEQKQG